ncbi:MAG: tetratricopeptide repeat protein [Candidatus Niyogibacteria bacterium]|nr:tetratricopeptide repeat protein [Candidatus Niyogibacteria bacterium]
MNHAEMYVGVREEYMSAPEEVSVVSSAQADSLYDKLARALLYVLGFLLPLWALPMTAMPVEINKAYLAHFLILGAFVLWLFGRIRESAFTIPKSGFVFAAIFMAAVWGIAAFFSTDSAMSLVGQGYEIGTALSVALAALAVFLFSVLFQDGARVMKWLIVLFVSAAVLFALQAWNLSGTPGFLSGILNSNTASLIGGWNTLGAFAGLILLLSLALFDLPSPVYMRVGFLLLALAAIFFLAVVNFTDLWWVIAILLFAFLSHLFLVRRESQALTVATFAVLLIAFFFMFAPPTVGEWVSAKFGIAFIEARPSWGTTMEIVKSALKADPFLGSGPNTFIYDWIAARPQSLNATLFWGSRFTAGVGHLPSFAATTGILGLIAILVLLGSFLWRGGRVTLNSLLATDAHDEGRYLLFVTFFGALYLWTTNIIYTPGFALFLLAFIFSALFIALAASRGLVKNVSLRLFERSATGFVSVMAMIFILLFSVSVAYRLSTKYFAAYDYGEGVKAFNAGDLSAAQTKFMRAMRTDETDLYYRSLVELDIKQMANILAQTNLSVEELRAKFQTALAQAVNDGQAAVRLGRMDPLNWLALGKVYEAIVPFKVSGASQVALDTYAEATKRDPQNPEVLLAEARVAVATNDFAKAKEFLDAAIALKSDYTPARFLMVQVESQLGHIEAAIKQGETARLQAPNDIGLLFQLGMLYYRNGNLTSAGSALENSIMLNPSYANARYFLGLIYSQLGRKQDAILQFEVILALNPGNAEVVKILENLKSGKPALTTISPPAPSPEKRIEPPVK